MAIPAKGRLKWRLTAPYQVQFELEKSDDQRAKGQTQIRGRVVRVFRTDGRLAVGDRVEFPLWVCERGGEPTGPAHIYHDKLDAARFMEAYLTGTPPACELAAYEFEVISAPTDQPTMSPDDMEKAVEWEKDQVELFKKSLESKLANAPKWWQFWKARRG